MLIQPNASMLGDTHLDAKENLAKLKEGNAKLVEKQKLVQQSELEDSQRSGGPRMPYQELLRKLRELNSNIKALDGSPGNIALYVLKTRKQVAETPPDELENLERDVWFIAHKYVTGFPKEPLPEYSSITVDERGLAKRDLRSWRSVLISLIKVGAITYQQAEQKFGPALGSRAWRYEEQLQKFRYQQ